MTRQEMMAEISYVTDLDEKTIRTVINAQRYVCMMALSNGEDFFPFNGMVIHSTIIPECKQYNLKNRQMEILKDHYRYNCSLSRRFKNELRDFRAEVDKFIDEPEEEEPDNDDYWMYE